MKKNNFSIENLKIKSKEFCSDFFDNIKLHTDNILMLVFFAMIVAWGFIFYNFAYKVSVSNPEVSVSVVKIKKERLDKIADDIKKREIKRENIDFSDIKNPFLDDVMRNDAEISEKSAIGTISGRVEQIY